MPHIRFPMAQWQVAAATNGENTDLQRAAHGQWHAMATLAVDLPLSNNVRYGHRYDFPEGSCVHPRSEKLHGSRIPGTAVTSSLWPITKQCATACGQAIAGLQTYKYLKYFWRNLNTCLLHQEMWRHLQDWQSASISQHFTCNSQHWGTMYWPCDWCHLMSKASNAKSPMFDLLGPWPMLLDLQCGCGRLHPCLLR